MGTNYALTSSQADLDAVCDAAHAAGRLGIDTEFLWEKTYAPRLCVVQLTADGEATLVDSLADSIDLSPVADLLDDPDVEVVMHAPHADLVAFALQYDCEPTNIFDIQLAAGFVGLGAGLAYEKLVKEATGAKAAKGEGYTDWSRRPLNDRQLRYAAADVEHLFQVADVLQEKLEDMGRYEWARTEMSQRYEAPGALVTDPFEAWQKVGRRGRLDRDGIRKLRRVAAWREVTARDKDLPSSWLVKDASLIEVARRNPTDHQSLAKVRGLPKSIVERHGGEILDALAQAGDDKLERGGPPPPPGSRERLNATRGIATSVMRMRCDDALISPEIVGTTKDVEALSIAVFAATDGRPDADASPLLRGWRKDIVGDELVALLRGERTIRVLPEEPFLDLMKSDEVASSRA